MVKVKIAEAITLENCPQVLIRDLQGLLWITNDDYIKKIRLNKWLGNTPKKLNLYIVNENKLIVPYGVKDYVLKRLNELDIPFVIDDVKVRKKVDFKVKENLNLFDYQKEATKELLKYDNGILISPAGSGKTRMAMDIIGKIGVKTLWITHTLDLLTQSKRVFKQFYSNKVGEISGGKINIQDITFATVQTLSNVDFEKFKDEFDAVVIDECFDKDTEILTIDGFVKFKDLKDQKVAQYHENGSIEFVEPIRKIKNKHEGKLLELHLHRDAKVLMTPNHNHVYRNNKNELVRKEIKDIKRMRKIVSGKGIGNGSYELTPLERLFIITQADGYKTSSNTNQYQISFSRQRKIDRFFKVISELDIDIKLKEVKDRIGRRRFTYYLPLEFEPKLLTNVFKLEDFSYEKAQDFINEVCEWDGYKSNGKNANYDSIIKENADFVSAVATLGGYANYQVVKVDNRKETYSDIHRVFFLEKETQSMSEQKVVKEEVYYNDYVYCVEVPTHNIVVRSQGKTFISGNCHRVGGTPNNLTMFYKVLSNLNAKYKYGITATIYPKQNDSSITPLILIGDIKHEVLQENVPRVTATHIPIMLDTPVSDIYLAPDKTINYNDLLAYLTYDMERNNVILNKLLETKDKHNVVLTNRNDQLAILSEMLEHNNIPHKVLIGEMKAKDREITLKEFSEGKFKMLLSNYQLAKEGLDLPIADTLHLVMPMRDKRTIIQSKGRVERIYNGKTEAIVYDYVDKNIYMLYNMFKERRRYF